MLRRHKGLPVAIATAGTLLSVLALGPVTTASAAPAWRNHVCHGTGRHPGELVGRNLNVVVRGLCLVRLGPVAVSGSIIITRGSTLIAAYGRHDSRINVAGNVVVRRGGSLILGCEPRFFPCLDSRHPKHSHLSSRSTIGGSLVAIGALGAVVHNTWIGHNVLNLGGGGGLTCRPQGVFAAHHSPAYVDYEDNWIGGSMWVKFVRTCWMGVLRNWVGGTARVSRNRAVSKDAMEVVGNTVHGNLVCWNNRPKVQFGDSRGMPNRVGLGAFLECSFRRILPNPANQHVHFNHISVRL